MRKPKISVKGVFFNLLYIGYPRDQNGDHKKILDNFTEIKTSIL